MKLSVVASVSQEMPWFAEVKSCNVCAHQSSMNEVVSLLRTGSFLCDASALLSAITRSSRFVTHLWKHSAKETRLEQDLGYIFLYSLDNYS